MTTDIKLAPIGDFRKNLRALLNILRPQTVSKFALAMKKHRPGDTDEYMRMTRLDSIMLGKSTLAQVKDFDKILQVFYMLVETAAKPATVNSPSDGLEFISEATSIERQADYIRFCKMLGLKSDDEFFNMLIAFSMAIMPFLIKAVFSEGSEAVLNYYYAVCKVAHLPTIKV